jgi:hypothetical protein
MDHRLDYLGGGSADARGFLGLKPSNTVPTESETIHARKLLSIAEVDVHRLNLSSFPSLFFSPGKLVPYVKIKECKIILALHKRLPPELVSEIL